jgi:hypothetical protein
MSTLRAFFPVLAATVIAGPPLAAHHGRGATFDMKKQLTLKGTVSQVRWQNPHVLISIAVKDEGSNVVTWTFGNSNVHTPTSSFGIRQAGRCSVARFPVRTRT